jgi:hypothetical protein
MLHIAAFAFLFSMMELEIIFLFQIDISIPVPSESILLNTLGNLIEPELCPRLLILLHMIVSGIKDPNIGASMGCENFPFQLSPH